VIAEPPVMDFADDDGIFTPFKVRLHLFAGIRMDQHGIIELLNLCQDPDVNITLFFDKKVEFLML